MIDRSIKEKEDAKVALKQSVKAAQESCKIVEENSQNQKVYAQEILKKITVWSDAVDLVKEQETKERQQGTRAITALVKKQEKALFLALATKEVSPIALNNAEKELIKIFTLKDKQQDFLNQAIKDLELEKV